MSKPPNHHKSQWSPQDQHQLFTSPGCCFMTPVMRNGRTVKNMESPEAQSFLLVLCASETN